LETGIGLQNKLRKSRIQTILSVSPFIAEMLLPFLCQQNVATGESKACALKLTD
jgi:hypothetical protein